MNKAELIEALADRFDGNKAEAGRALAAVTDTIIEQVARGEKVTITGFGIFERVHRPARMVRNPRTGESKKAKATYVPRFRAGSELKAYASGEKKLSRGKKKTVRAAATAAATRTTRVAPAKRATPARAAAGAVKKTATSKSAARRGGK